MLSLTGMITFENFKVKHIAYMINRVCVCARARVCVCPTEMPIWMPKKIQTTMFIASLIINV